ncbi:MAG: hypothetical protein B7Z08_04175 [Sphingomonadales bacterium 32-68-7]|nr:MAG: hypothetical protein B7Z33_13640 [Sphingomonadales bacterium 12-68-11]OYX09726.1 MAG: hypothetical protein B7Z08_04175 [Sphingomonadales bacterium 32-68-7]
MGAEWSHFAERPERRREPANAHFRHMAAAPAKPGQADAVQGSLPGRFEIYRADQVRMSSLQFVGGDWHWRLCTQAGEELVDAGGYRTEAACLAAVAVLKEHAGRAVLAASA